MTNFINDVAEVPVVVKLAGQVAPHISEVIAPGWHSSITTGKFVGLNSSGQMREAGADSATLIPAVGAVAFKSQNDYSVAGETGNLEFQVVDAYRDSITFNTAALSPALTPGQAIWLTSGGDISQDYPNVTGNIRQQVGWAVSAQEYIVQIGTPAIVGG